jgi:RNA polymerase sigma factor (sigma-70 family)
MDDQELVRQVLTGNREAYAELIRRYAGQLHAVCRACVWRVEDAEELAQEALYRGLRDLATLHDPSRFAPWLFGIARNICRNWRKDKQNAQVTFTDCDAGQSDGHNQTLDVPCSETSPDPDVEDLTAAVQALPEDCREVLLLYYSGGVTYRDLAARLEVSTATINARLTRARELLRQRLRKAGCLR